MPERSRLVAQRMRRGRSRLAAIGGVLALFAWRHAWRQMTRKPHAAAPAMAAAEREHERPMTAYEPTDWAIGPIAVVYAGLLALLVISCFVLVAAYPTALPDVSRNKRIAPPGPQLQTNPRSDLERFRSEERKRLETYYWFDRQNGVVHIPIEQAMKNIVQTGLPGFPKAPQ